MYHLGLLITEIHDHIVKKILELTRQSLKKEIKLDFSQSLCWLVFGSEGRQEQTLITDQDNGIVYADTPFDVTDYSNYFGKKAVNYLLLLKKEPVETRIGRIYIPKITRALYLASIDVIRLPLSESTCLTCIGLFDGEEFHFSSVVSEFYEVSGWEDPLMRINKLISEGFSLVVYDYELLEKDLREGGLRPLLYTIEGARREGRVREVSSLARNVLGEEIVSMDYLAPLLGIDAEVGIDKVLTELERSKKEIEERGIHVWPYYTKYLMRRLSLIHI